MIIACSRENFLYLFENQELFFVFRFETKLLYIRTVKHKKGLMHILTYSEDGIATLIQISFEKKLVLQMIYQVEVNVNGIKTNAICSL